MVRTKADAGATKVAAAKAPRKMLGGSTSSNKSNKDGGSKYGAGNSYNPKLTPDWQQGITSFFKAGESSTSKIEKDKCDEVVEPSSSKVDPCDEVVESSSSKVDPCDEVVESSSSKVDPCDQSEEIIEEQSDEDSPSKKVDSVSSNENVSSKKVDREDEKMDEDSD